MAATVGILLLAATLLFAPLHTALILAGDDGTEYAAFPLREGESFSVTFVHSVNKSPVTDVYEIRDGIITVVQTVYYAFGAGVQTELEEGQTLSYGPDGEMIVSGFDRPLPNLSYIVGTVSDHTLTIDGAEVSLRALCGRNSTVRFSFARRSLLRLTDIGQPAGRPEQLSR